jgi:EthD domain
MSAKLIYRAERHPVLDRHGFRARWRRHAALGMSQPRWTNIRRYAHCDPVDDRAPWDGVALLWYRDENARLRHIADPTAREIMRADEAETFARPVRAFSTLVTETPQVPAHAASYKLFVFIWRGGASTRDDFVANALRDHAHRRRERLATLPGFRGIALNIARSEAELSAFGLGCDAIEESDWDAPLDIGPDPIPRAARVEPLWTRHVLLYDCDSQP